MSKDTHQRDINRRQFLALGAGTPLLCSSLFKLSAMSDVQGAAGSSITENAAATLPKREDAKVVLASCRSYQAAEIRKTLTTCLDQLGGIGSRVKNRTVTVKINLTGTEAMSMDGRLAGETYMTHPTLALVLADLLFRAGARRVRFVESTNSRDPLEETLTDAGWEIPEFAKLGKVEFENTRNMGLGKHYSKLPVKNSGYLFSHFELNHSYEDTDFFLSLSKLKNHRLAGVTLSIKNLFGITPNSLYGDGAPHEEAIEGRLCLHLPYLADCPHWEKFPGSKNVEVPRKAGYRIPHILADIVSARPVDLALLDGITSIAGAEGPWAKARFVTPGVIIAGLNPVSADAVATAVMGYPDPRAPMGTAPFKQADNHILLAEQAGLGIAELNRIEILGLPLEKALYRFDQ
jgi:uncharacterized protein (DUF362 family)